VLENCLTESRPDDEHPQWVKIQFTGDVRVDFSENFRQEIATRQ